MLAPMSHGLMGTIIRSGEIYAGNPAEHITIYARRRDSQRGSITANLANLHLHTPEAVVDDVPPEMRGRDITKSAGFGAASSGTTGFSRLIRSEKRENPWQETSLWKESKDERGIYDS